VTTKHIIAAGPHSLNGHAQAAPDAIGSRHADNQGAHHVHIGIIDGKVLLAALQMRSRYAQRRDQHGDAAQQENRARQSKESPQ